jgi:Uma2 family endonuclease
MRAATMTAVLKSRLISVEDYLAGELVSQIRHEYLGGIVYAMAGARIAHNIIETNILVGLHTRLRGKRCQPNNSNTKVHIELVEEERFYYPDVSVVCNSKPQNESYQDEPVVIFEVLSKSTRRIDEGEKKDAYLTIPSLSAYVLVEQESAGTVVYRRTRKGFIREVLDGLKAVLRLSKIGVELPLSEVYETIEFSPEPEPDDN